MDGVDELLTLLTALKSNGWDATFAEDELNGGHGQRCENSHPYPEPLRRSLEESKRCMKALDRIRQHIGRKIRTLRRRCTPLILEKGIRHMPDELLAHIFEMGHNSVADSEFSLTVSHVSHRFRQVALQTPVLWTRLARADPLDQTKIFISRSGHANLEVDLRYSQYGKASSYSAFLKVVGPLSTRWLSITGVDEVVSSKITSAGFYEFPNLLHLASFNWETMTCWKTPLLTSIQGRDCVLNRKMSPLSQLTTINLRFAEEYVDFLGLFETLHTMKSIQDLSLELVDCSGQSHCPISHVRALQVLEPHSFNMETLNITIMGRTSHVVVESLYDALSYLAPSTMVISLEHSSNSNALIYNTMGRLFPYGSTIRLRIRQRCNIFHLLAGLAQSCDIVRSIYLVTPAGSFQSDLSLLAYQHTAALSLRHLRIEKVSLSPEDHVKSLAQTFLSTNNDDRSRSLEFVSCEQISEDFLLELQDEVGDGLKWSW